MIISKSLIYKSLLAHTYWDHSFDLDFLPVFEFSFRTGYKVKHDN